MRAKIFKTVLATAMCTMLLGLQVSAAGTALDDGELTNDDSATAEADKTLEGESDLEEPIFRIAVPFELEFALDPFEQQGASQVWSADYPIINKSNVNVNVNVALKVESKKADGTNDVTFMSSADSVSSLTDTSKSLYIAAAVPLSTNAIAEVAETPDYDAWGTDAVGYIAVTSTEADEEDVVVQVEGGSLSAMQSSAIDFAADTLGYTEASLSTADANAQEISLENAMILGDSTTYAEVPMGTTATTLSFYLAKAEYQNYKYADGADVKEGKVLKGMAADEKGSSLYRFIGTANARANWIKGEVGATAVYSFRGVLDKEYDTVAFAGHGLQKSGYAYDEEAAIANYNTTEGLVYIRVTADGLMTADGKLTKVEISVDGDEPVEVTTTNYLYDYLTITTAVLETAVGAYDSDSVYDIYLTYDGVVYKVTITEA